MGEMADWLTEDYCLADDDWDDDAEITHEPIIWTDHTGRAWRLSQMKTSHLIFINRLVVNQWALALGLRPVPIKNSIAILDPNRTPEQVIEVARRARVMAEDVLRRLEAGERLDGGVTVVWERVVNKYQECLRKSGQPLHQGMLRATGAALLSA